MTDDTPLSAEHIENLYRASAQFIGTANGKELSIEIHAAAISANATASLLIEQRRTNNILLGIRDALDRLAPARTGDR